MVLISSYLILPQVVLISDFANQMVQGIAECVDDPDTARDARNIVLLVENHTGIRLI